MTQPATIGSIHVHGVNKENIDLRVRYHDTFTSITIELGGSTNVTLICDPNDIAAILRKLANPT